MRLATLLQYLLHQESQDKIASNLERSSHNMEGTAGTYGVAGQWHISHRRLEKQSVENCNWQY
jgi:hypothetical protein